MTSSMMRAGRLSLMLVARATIVTAAAAAQQPARVPPGAVVQPRVPDNGAELRRHLTTLADNPRSLDALIGAGRAALQTGDAEAALSFFGRADEISPRNPRIRAGMASALLQMARAQPALTLFAEAVSLGAPVAEIAGDRGLAWDMLGEPRRAQQDYTLALRRRHDPELQRRMALSLAISGQREAALRIIDAQLRRNDRAAWRTQAFVLALTGDAAGASRTAHGTMPPGAAQAMAPFLARLAGLGPAQKAMAVHFGHFPSDGRAQAAAGRADISADPGALALAMGGAPPAPVAATARPQRPVAAAPVTRRRSGDGRAARQPVSRRRAGRDYDSSDPRGLRTATRPPLRQQLPAPAPQPADQRPVEIPEIDTRWAGAPPLSNPQRQIPAPQPAAPRPTHPAQTPPQQTPPQQAATPSAAAPQPQAGDVIATPLPLAPSVLTEAPTSSRPVEAGTSPPAAIVTTPRPSPPVEIAGTVAGTAIPSNPREAPSTAAGLLQLPETDATPGFTLIPSAGESAPAPAAPGPLADIASIVNALPQEPAPALAPAPAPPVRRSEPARPAQVRAAAPAPVRTRAARPAHPSRHWVQIAGGANKTGLPREFARLRAQAPELAGRAAWTTPLNATNRLLVGPFASTREAQEFVNRLAQRQVAAFAWTSPAGQEIERLAAAR